MNDEDIQQKITHFNYPQQRAWIVNANTTIAILGRGTGKDHGIVTPITLRNAKEMPRGATGFIGPTYVKIKGDLLPSLTKALEKFGFYEEVDYWIGQFIPKKVKSVKPFECPRDPQYSIFWTNGHINRLIGLDRKDSANGQSNDYVLLNEARFVKEADYKSRVVPTNRGNEDLPHFAKLHYHHGILITSDQPTNAEGKWILNFKQFHDQEQIDLIVSYDQAHRELIKDMADHLLRDHNGVSIQIKYDRDKLLETMRDLVLKGQLTEALNKRFRTELARLDNALFELRRECVYTLYASTLDNIDVVTERYIRQMSRVLTPKQFNTSILNLEDDSAEEMFYSTFDEDRHTYDDIEYNYLDMFKNYQDADEPWKKDGDIDTKRGLAIGCDWNKKITSMVVGQPFSHAVKVLNSFHVLDPLRIKHVAKAFNDYYATYPNKRVTHFYDHTATGQNALMEKSYADEMRDELSALGWRVDEVYIGQTDRHDLREKFFRRVFAEDDPNTPIVRINRMNCPDMITALKGCGTKSGKLGAEKDKRPENRKSVPPQHAPHFTDAFDTLIGGVMYEMSGNSIYEPDFVT
ncbi:hypothetical protein KHS38_12105 [Mucilaginibacter sp. Bleaf8]|uniref:hypothetical protein n=1 Tax=Mucilaginibacter sp. Bleaf8 TaxID=2834430 RepID=UPI001BD14442|nr:hypothetical protein [Mucilaginibacter sp. Bleaf8]MBS7565148.1 hypothetical protein [Mucilaginibacter sp. Bleaf8]